MKVSEKIKQRLIAAGVNYHADDNISDHIQPGELELLEQELIRQLHQILISWLVGVEILQMLHLVDLHSFNKQR